MNTTEVIWEYNPWLKNSELPLDEYKTEVCAGSSYQKNGKEERKMKIKVSEQPTLKLVGMLLIEIFDNAGRRLYDTNICSTESLVHFDSSWSGGI